MSEWCNSMIGKLLTHHQEMQRFTADQMTQWNSAFQLESLRSLEHFMLRAITPESTLAACPQRLTVSGG